MKTQWPLQTVTIAAAEDLVVEGALVGYDGKTCAAGKAALGVLAAKTLKDEQAPVTISGVMLGIASAEIAVGAALEAATGGKLVTQTTGVLVGYALDAAAADKDIIRFKLA